MPEGDTIHRSARTLARAIGDKEVLRFESRHRTLPSMDLSGERVVSVEAKGKNLLIDFGVALLHTHMKMRGAWHIYRPGDRWKRAKRDAEILIVTRPWTAVGFSIPVARWVRRERALATLGPDLLDEGVESERFVQALRSADAPLGVALMDQRLLSGIGNVYKSELCFMTGVSPFSPASSFEEETLRELIEAARRALRRNLHTPRRMLRPDRTHPLWVYERRAQLCFRCATPIEMTTQGDPLRGEQIRSTYYCPKCQSAKAD